MPQELSGRPFVQEEIVTDAGRQGGYFFFNIATTMATIVEINTASKVRAANTIVSTWYVVIAFTPFQSGVSAATLRM